MEITMIFSLVRNDTRGREPVAAVSEKMAVHLIPGDFVRYSPGENSFT
jgi:hypothetical protein